MKWEKLQEEEETNNLLLDLRNLVIWFGNGFLFLIRWSCEKKKDASGFWLLKY